MRTMADVVVRIAVGVQVVTNEVVVSVEDVDEIHSWREHTSQLGMFCADAGIEHRNTYLGVAARETVRFGETNHFTRLEVGARRGLRRDRDRKSTRLNS